MEHRCHKRVVVSLDVMLKFREGPSQPARIRDIGLGGLFVELEQGELAQGRALEVELCLPQGGDQRPFVMKAWVVHSGAGGAGLMLRAIEQKDYHALRRFLGREPLTSL